MLPRISVCARANQPIGSVSYDKYPSGKADNVAVYPSRPHLETWLWWSKRIPRFEYLDVPSCRGIVTVLLFDWITLLIPQVLIPCRYLLIWWINDRNVDLCSTPEFFRPFFWYFGQILDHRYNQYPRQQTVIKIHPQVVKYLTAVSFNPPFVQIR